MGKEICLNAKSILKAVVEMVVITIAVNNNIPLEVAAIVGTEAGTIVEGLSFSDKNDPLDIRKDIKKYIYSECKKIKASDLDIKQVSEKETISPEDMLEILCRPKEQSKKILTGMLLSECPEDKKYLLTPDVIEEILKGIEEGFRKAAFSNHNLLSYILFMEWWFRREDEQKLGQEDSLWAIQNHYIQYHVNLRKERRYFDTSVAVDSTLSEFVQDKELFDSLIDFTQNQWQGDFLYHLINFRKSIEVMEKEKNLLITFYTRCYEILKSNMILESMTEEMKKCYNELLESLETEKISLPVGIKINLNIINQKLQRPQFENCLLLSGYFGSGKSRFSIEAGFHETISSNAYFIYPSLKGITDTERLKNAIDSEIQKAFGGREQCLTVLKEDTINNTLVIVLDDIHQLFRQGIPRKEFNRFIGYHSYPQIKWVLITQTDELQEYKPSERDFLKKFAYIWPWQFNSCQIDQWLYLDQWYKRNDNDIVKKIVQEHLAISSSDWRWGDEVKDTNYYNPLLALVLLSQGEKPFLQKDLYYPGFCEYYYQVLREHGDDSVDEIVARITRHFWKTMPTGLLFEPEDGSVKNKECNKLTRVGLLEKQDQLHIGHATYAGVPEPVWVYTTADYGCYAANLKNEKCIPAGIMKKFKKGDPDLVNKIISMIFLMKNADLDLDEKKVFFQKCSEKNFGEIVFLAAPKLDAATRNELITDIMCSHKIEVEKKYSRHFLHLCSEGGLDGKLLRTCIIFIGENLCNRNLDIDLFGFMLRRNYETLEINELLACIDPLDQFQQKYGSSESAIGHYNIMGKDLTGQVSKQHSWKQDQNSDLDLVKAVIEKYDHTQVYDSGKSFFTIPSTITDFFAEYFCDEVVYNCELSFIEDQFIPTWYTFDQPNWHQERRNKLLIMALGYAYRCNAPSSAVVNHKEYLHWYNCYVKKLSTGTIGEKQMATMMIVHTGENDNDYEIDPCSKLLPTMHQLSKDPDVKELLNIQSVATFIETNCI